MACYLSFHCGTGIAHCSTEVIGVGLYASLCTHTDMHVPLVSWIPAGLGKTVLLLGGWKKKPVRLLSAQGRGTKRQSSAHHTRVAWSGHPPCVLSMAAASLIRHCHLGWPSCQNKIGPSPPLCLLYTVKKVTRCESAACIRATGEAHRASGENS